MNEWLAVHGLSTYLYSIVYYWLLTYVIAVDFFNHLNMLYGTVTEFCSQQEVKRAVAAPVWSMASHPALDCLAVSRHVRWSEVITLRIARTGRIS